MSEIYSDDNGARVIVRHKGPAGRGFPAGGTTGQVLIKASGTNYDAAWQNSPSPVGAAVGPASAANNNVAVFDGTTGKLIKDGGQPLSNYASVSLVATKQDTEVGKGLSQENFTTVLKDKLDGLAQNFRGTYATSVAVTEIADPVAGDYAVVEVVDEPQQVAFWDSVNEEWDFKIVEPMTGQEIADVLFDTVDAGDWDKDLCRIFTEAEKTQLAQHQSALDSLGIADLTRPYGSINYFDMTGTLVAIAAASDGQTNMVKVDVPTSLGASGLSFDAGTSTARLRYTGSATRVFKITAVVSANIAINDVCVFGIARNGSVDLTTRVLQKSAVGGAAHSTVLTAQISMSLNDYLEIFVGNTTDTDDVTVHALRIDVNPV
jgi:hypothetical protein